MQYSDKNGNIIKEPKWCKYCGGVYDASCNYTGKEDDECFTCWHWRTNLEADQREPGVVVIIEGEHYRIREEPKPNTSLWMLGYGGSKFIIQFNDGRLVTTHNLWHQGKITSYWQAHMPDNAKFVEKGGN